MLFRILKSIKQIFLESIPADYEKEFITSINKTNVNRGIITAIATITIEIMMLAFYFIINKDNYFKKPDVYYGLMYILMLLGMTAFLILFKKIKKDVQKHEEGIRYAGVFFTAFILLWCGGISLLDQLSDSQVIVYIVAVISVGAIPFYKPSVLLMIYLATHLFFVILSPYFQNSSDLLFGNYINTTTTVIISWSISFMRYKKHAEDFNNKRIIKEKNDELEIINKQLEEANKKLEVLSTTDSLTKTYNRFIFEVKIKDEWIRCSRYSKPLSLIMADIDYFKSFNDNYGHQAGDNCIKQIAEVLCSCVKRSSDVVARYGGEEFAIILPDMQKEYAILLAEQMRRKVEQLNLPHLHSHISNCITISLGVNTIIPSAESSIEEFIKNTDMALYEAKKNRNCAAAHVI